MYKITEAVKHLLIINILMYIAANVVLPSIPASNSTMEFFKYFQVNGALHFPLNKFFEPWQIVTHMFMHGNTSHLFFNMFGLFMFGPPLERLWGTKKFLIFYFVAAFGAALLYQLVWAYGYTQMGALEQHEFLNQHYRMLGASGAIFGLLAGYGYNYPNSIIQLLIPPIPIKAKYFVIIYAAIELFLGIGGVQSGVAHFAHVGGALFGFLLMVYWRKTGR